MNSLKLTNSKFELITVDVTTIKEVTKASGGRTEICFTNKNQKSVVVEEAYEYVLAELESVKNEQGRILADINYYIEEKGMSCEEANLRVMQEEFEAEHSPKSTDFL